MNLVLLDFGLEVFAEERTEARLDRDRAEVAAAALTVVTDEK